MTDGLLNSINEKYRLYNYVIQDLANNVLRQQYNNYKNKLRLLIKTTKKITRKSKLKKKTKDHPLFMERSKFIMW